MMAEKTCVKVLVEENGEHGFDSYRVPGIVTASNGDLLLAYEGREAGGNPQNFILQEISDKGRTAAARRRADHNGIAERGRASS